jgi:hypothetical protein
MNECPAPALPSPTVTFRLALMHWPLAALAPPEPSPPAPDAVFVPVSALLVAGAELAVLVAAVDEDVVEVSDEAVVELGLPQAAVSRPTAMTPATAAMPKDLVMDFASSRTQRFEYPIRGRVTPQVVARARQSTAVGV